MIGKLFVRLIVGVLIGGLLGAGGVAYSVWKVARVTENHQADAIVVLGAAQYDGVPSPVFQWRLQHALDLWRDGYAPRIITVGGNKAGDQFTEASAGKRWLVEEGGVPSDQVVAVEKGANTLSSARAVGEVLTKGGWTSAIVVTDPPHMLRSTTMIADQGIVVYGSPTRAGPAVQSRRNQLESIAYETGALLYYAFIGTAQGSGESS